MIFLHRRNSEIHHVSVVRGVDRGQFRDVRKMKWPSRTLLNFRLAQMLDADRRYHLAVDVGVAGRIILIRECRSMPGMK